MSDEIPTPEDSTKTIYPYKSGQNPNAGKWINPRLPSQRYAFLEASYSGQGGYADGSYLIPHQREELAAFGARKAKARIINDFRTIIDGWVSPIFAVDPQYSISENLDETQIQILAEFMLDCDGAGTTYRAWLKKFARASRKYDSAFALLDSERTPNSLPFLELFTPDKIVSISLDGKGKVLEAEWAAQKEERQWNEASIVSKGRLRIDKFRYTFTFDGKIVDQGDNDLGYVPMIPLYPEGNDSPQTNPLPYGLAYTLATIQHRRYCLSSICDEISDGQAFSVLCIAGEVRDITLGVGNALTGLPEQGNMPAYINPDAGQLKILLEQCDKMTADMYRTGNMPHLQSFPQTAEAKKIDQERTKEALGDFQQQIAKADEKIIKMLGDYLGIDFEYKVTYSTSFDDEEISELVDIVQTLNNANGTPELSAEFEKKIARQVTKGDDDDYEELEKAIDDHYRNFVNPANSSSFEEPIQQKQTQDDNELDAVD